jgi:hypothetical protein
MQYIYTLVKSSLSQQEYTSIYADLPLEHEGTSTVPIDVVITAQKPDLVIVNSKDKHVTLFELSVPFERNIESTHELKVNRYRQLKVDIEDNGFKVDYYPVELGSRGFISKDNEARLKSFFRKNAKDTKYSNIKPVLCKTILVGSFVIYHSKYEEAGINPKYVSFDS